MRALLTEGQEAQNVILRSLEVDMRDVRDRLTMIEAKDIIGRLTGVEQRVSALEEKASQQTGAAKLAQGVWVVVTSLASMGVGAVILKLFGGG